MDKKTFTVLLGSMFIAMLGMNIISPFLPVYAKKMGASSLELGLVQSAFSASGTITLLFVGRLSDRLGRKVFLAGGIFILIITSMALMFAAQPADLIFLRFLQGFGASTFLGIAQAYMGDRIRSGNEGKWMGYFNAVLFAGMGSGPLLGGMLTDRFGISTTFLTLAAANSLGLAAVLFFIKEMPRKAAVREHRFLLSPLKSRIMRGVICFRFTVGISTAALMAFVPLFAGLKIGLSPTLIGAMLAARIPISLCQTYTGRMADVWSRRHMVIGGGLIATLAIAGMPSAHGFWALLIAYLIVTIGQALGIPAANAYVVQEGRIYGMGTSVTMFMMSMYAGNSIGPIVLGGIADALSLEWTFYAASLCLVFGLALFIWFSKLPSKTKKLHSASSF